MAKKSMLAREQKRQKTVAKYAAKRMELKSIVKNRSLDAETRWAAQQELQSLPRDANPIRMQRRCEITGRPRGVYRRFGLGRNKLRESAMRGDIPGLKKSSW